MLFSDISEVADTEKTFNIDNMIAIGRIAEILIFIYYTPLTKFLIRLKNYSKTCLKTPSIIKYINFSRQNQPC